MVNVCRNLCPVARVPVARCNDANLTNIVFLPMSEMQLFFLIYGMCLMFYDDVVDIHSQATHAVEKNL